MIDYKSKTDEEIVSIVVEKDDNAYSQIIDRYQEKLLRYTKNLLQDKDNSSCVTQDTFIKAFINLKSFDTQKKFSSWIYRIAHNEAINFIFKHKKQEYLPENFDVPEKEDIVENLEKKENLEILKKCIKAIPIKYSEPIILFYFEQKSYEEISEILRIPEGTVATRINRAKKIIKNICQKKI
ncbi:MAG TPA: RNA polymerase sigma factor [Candidatus Paceibacterota bacterium]|nr:RNA polymerase sigma factor [Candidatus Paceibacterota bacterium]HMP19257.1 RNA polymerase sigma factor [Candidatus Paceibacterota bacterium]HMP85528.1 RNA polymerase sigma factor [Candidatus Paceibacterota bacterium]